MPTYTYACTACGEQLEAIQSFTDPSLTECPACGGQLRKVFSAVGVVFKGSGFYRNDSRSSKPTGDKPGGDHAAAAKTESTPAAKKEGSSTSSESKTKTTSAPSSSDTSSRSPAA